ncbi:hypothetical protein WJX81_000082 [Elliptochloris bilobata]|uniref:DNA replication ATP-dependent helicase/nuclease n=1 Tax=Elliptochloris bilobata TaxID=381761 RepID=A0AAW1SL34_9CHLO
MPFALKKKTHKSAVTKKCAVPRAGQSILAFFDKRPPAQALVPADIAALPSAYAHVLQGAQADEGEAPVVPTAGESALDATQPLCTAPAQDSSAGPQAPQPEVSSAAKAGSTRKCVVARKRHALLALLDQVELVVEAAGGDKHAVCDCSTGALVLLPDVLLSGTRVSSSFKCVRQAVLEERYGGDSSAKAVQGTLLHELFQAALLDEHSTADSLEAHARSIALRHTDKLLDVGLDEQQALAVMQNGMAGLLAWLHTFRRATPAEDASVRVDGACLSRGLAPLEFKTGKAHQSHRAQVTLYLLLLEERYGAPMSRGLLWYLSQPRPEVVRRVPEEVSALLMQRNQLASALAHGTRLPPLLRDPRACGGCFQLSTCTLAHKALEAGTAGTAGMGAAFEEHTGHMAPSHVAFLRHWLQLIDMEEGGLIARRAEIWALSGAEREALGRCIAGLALQSSPDAAICEPGCHLYTFARALEGSASQAVSLEDMGFAEGDMVVLSVEGCHAALARGHMHSIFADAVTVALGKALRPNLLSDVPPGTGPCWRIDRDEVSSISVRLRRSLMGLFARGDAQARKLRRLVVDLQAPATVGAQQHGVDAPELNPEQLRAVDRVLAMNDYTLILGMPGAGKTSTLVAAIRALVAARRSVLLSAYTNSAVDNVLLKLVEAGVAFVRLGRPGAVHPALQGYLPGGVHNPGASVAACRQLALTARVVACTCLGAEHAMLRGRTFDVCLVDEAGQLTLPAVLGPLLRARSFCLVGDHYQLPPLVQSDAAARQGLACPLFRRLGEAHPQAITTLRTQYRMAGSIMNLANHLVYNGQLRCASADVARAVLPLQLSGTQLAAMAPWLQRVLSPEHGVFFLDTCGPGAHERLAGETLCNPAEADLVIQVMDALQLGGVPMSTIGIMSPYRSQITLLQRLAKQRGWSNLEILTVDRFQGRDKAAILLTLVRSNKSGSAGRLLVDWRRINVAMTRAKHKLVFVGSSDTLAEIPLFGELDL